VVHLDHDHRRVLAAGRAIGLDVVYGSFGEAEQRRRAGAVGMTLIGRVAAPLLALVLVGGAACGAAPVASSNRGPAATGAVGSDAPAPGLTVTSRPSGGCTAPDLELAAVVDHPDGIEYVESAFLLHVPTGRSGEPLPLVVDMHGATGSRSTQESASGFGALGMREGFITITPQALLESRVWRLHPDGPDVANVRALLSIATERLCVDLARVYATGFSMGGMMAIALACDDPVRFAAIAPVAGTVEVEPCERAVPVPFLAVHGTADDRVGYDGRMAENVGVLIGSPAGDPVPKVVGVWGAGNGCSTEPPVADLPVSEVTGDVGRVALSCPPIGETELFVVEDGGHNQPGAPNGDPDRPGAGFDATATIWSFFARHARG